MAAVTLVDVTRDIDDHRILDHVSLTAADGEFVAIIGSSGAGKTSVIRAIAGFDRITGGTIRFDGDDMTSIATPDRDIGLVSQHNTLFPTERVRRNLLFPLLARGLGRAEADKRVDVESRANSISHIMDRWPATLSGGEQQLAQIARALVRRPRVFLMDEPLTRLDPPTRNRLRYELVEIQQGYGVTTIYVANRSDEIMAMPDRVVAMDHGRVVQTGTPDELFDEPATLSVAGLTGDIGTLTGTMTHDDDGVVVHGSEFALRLPRARSQSPIDEPVTIAVRSRQVRVSPSGPLRFTAGPITYEGDRRVRELRSPGGTVRTIDVDLTEGEQVSVWLERPLLFDRIGRRI